MPPATLIIQCMNILTKSDLSSQSRTLPAEISEQELIYLIKNRMSGENMKLMRHLVANVIEQISDSMT